MIRTGEQNLCPICDKKLEENNVILFPKCNHALCRDCLRESFEYKIKEQQVQLKFFVCFTCQIQLENNQWIQKVVDQKTFNKYCDQLIDQKMVDNLNSDEIVVTCKNQVCQQTYLIWKYADYYKCPKCNVEFCRKCNNQHNNEMPCEKEQNSYIVMKQNFEISKCPQCSFKVTKIGGCNFMTCICGTHFCYRCDMLLKREDHHKHYQQNDTSLSCKAQNRQSLPDKEQKKEKKKIKIVEINQIPCKLCSKFLDSKNKNHIYQCSSEGCNRQLYCTFGETFMNEQDIEQHLQKCFPKNDQIYSSNNLG
ncbi:unnamed protein product [Paramecium sonneborni]|uniref:RING-type domain-containing protein n=1 Tax=Paramecium sonneborni TaxID=65129 RepID=A0A8S1MCP3_9CILI|nr:unnamed protein product [Paramecium sonneborni]